MRTSLLLLLGACVVSCTSAPSPSPFPLPPSRLYSGVYISTPDEDYFTPCDPADVGDGWSLRFRDDESRAPFLQKVSAIRGYAPLTHFIRVRGRLGPPGSYNVGFQSRELLVDSLLSVSETLEPCRGFGALPRWSGLPVNLRDVKALALNSERRLAAVMDKQGQIGIWSTASGARIRTLPAASDVRAANLNGPMILSDDGKLLAVGGTDGIVRVWNVTDGRKIFSLPLTDSAASAAAMAKIPLPSE